MSGKIRDGNRVEVGAGEFQFRVVENWPQLPKEADFKEVVAVACDSQRRVYVFNRGNIPIMIFSESGQFVDSLDAGTFGRPHGITIGPDDTVYVVDDFDHHVQAFSLDGQQVLTLGVRGKHSGTGAESIDYRKIQRAGPPFNYPTNLAVAPSGHLYVTDGYGNARVHEFSPDGRLIHSWGTPGTGPGQFQVPHGIAISTNGIIYVADRENSRIQRFHLTGEFMDQWTDVARPCEVFVTDDGTVYVAELGFRAGRWPGWSDAPDDAIGGRVSIFDSAGNLLARWGGGHHPCAPGDFFAPHDIWVDDSGDFYVSEVVWSAGAKKGLVSPECHTIQKFSRLSASHG